jgi:hypothetical protein
MLRVKKLLENKTVSGYFIIILRGLEIDLKNTNSPFKSLDQNNNFL